MNTSLSHRDELLEAVKEPARKKQPSNFALYFAILFANIVFLTLDTISAFTVYWLTHIPLYGALTFLAGAIPLVMHEALYTRAFASLVQRRIAMVGAASSLLSIVAIGVVAGVINISGIAAEASMMEIVLIALLVLLGAYHGILAGVYFYVDPGIRMNQQTEQAIARAIQQGKQINAGDYILTITERSVAKRKAVGRGARQAAMDEVMRQLSGDDDGDGVPNYRDPDWRGAPSPVMANQTMALEELDPSHPPRSSQL